MEFKAVYLGHSIFVVNKSEKKIDKINQRELIFFLFFHINVCCIDTLKAPRKYYLNTPLTDLEQ